MFAEPIFIDGFAGGGGTSTEVEEALGRPVDVAINHNPAALAIHKANHPTTEHHCTDIRLPMLPGTVTRGRRVGGIWFSPDCKEFSKAKGGAVKDRSIRCLADEIPHWLAETKAEVAYVENVEEFEDWGPLEQGADGRWRVILDRKGEDFKKWVRRCRRLGYRVDWRQLRACNYGAPTSRKRLYIVMRRDKKPIVWPKATHGPPDSAAVRSGKLLPYRTAAECIDWSIPCPSIFERDRELVDATKRRVATGIVRHVLEAAKRGKVYIVGETAAHITKFHTGSVGSPIDKEMPTVTGNGQPSRPAGATPLGLVEAKIAPFITYGQHGGANRSATQPHHTIAASTKDTNGIVGATLVGVGGRRGQSPPMPVDGTYPTTTAKADNALATAELAFISRQFGNSVGHAATDPLGATTAGGGGKSAAVTAFLSSFYGSDKTAAAGDPEQPLRTVRAGGGKGGVHHAIVAAHMEQANTGMIGHPVAKPLSTIVGKGCTQRIVETTLIEEGALPPEMMDRAVRVAAFLVKYYGEGGQHQAADRPLDVVTTRARYAVVTVTIDAVTYVIVDIGLRMLKPRELARAQGFPDSYVLDPIVRKFLRGKWVDRPLTIAEQISAIGNSVCPPVARALVAANQPGLADLRMAA